MNEPKNQATATECSSRCSDDDVETTNEWLREVLPPVRSIVASGAVRISPIHCWDDLSWKFCIMLSGYEQFWTAPLNTRGKVRAWMRLMNMPERPSS